MYWFTNLFLLSFKVAVLHGSRKIEPHSKTILSFSHQLNVFWQIEEITCEVKKATISTSLGKEKESKTDCKCESDESVALATSKQETMQQEGNEMEQPSSQDGELASSHYLCHLIIL